MGRIKSTLIKRTGAKLMLKYEFTDNFEGNQDLIQNLMPSKRIANMVAGYITKKVKASNKGK